MAPQPPRATQDQELPDSLIRSENEIAGEGSQDDISHERGRAPLDQGGSDAPGDTGLTRREPIQRSPQDSARAAISKRFRRDEPENERPFNNDFADAENLYGEAGRPRDPNEDLSDEDYDAAAELAELTGQPVPQRGQKKPTTFREDVGMEDDRQPRMITRKVLGKNVTKSEEEWLADASKVSAADSYLAEARQLLKDAKEIQRGRTTQNRQNPDDDSAQDELDPPQDHTDQHPDPSMVDVVRSIQFGDPEEAAQLLESVVEKRANKASTEGALTRLYDQDLANSKKQLTAFSKANPDLAADELSAMAIEKGMYDLYREDILALGIEEGQLPKTPKELANWHRFYRIHGYEVRQTKDLLEKSKEKLLKWRGKPTAKDPANQQASRREPPRVRVNVDRDDRRMAIPVQPQRGVTPRRDAPVATNDGSSVVAQMRRARGQV